MFDIGFSELVLVAVIALLVLGPERLPTAAKTAGRWVGRARRMMNQLNQEIDKQIKLDDLREKLKEEGDKLGAEHIQQTVDSALQEAKKFEHLINQDVTATNPPSANASPNQHVESPSSSVAGPTSDKPDSNTIEREQGGAKLSQSEPAQATTQSQFPSQSDQR